MKEINMKKILVTGGTGMVGRELKSFLPDAYYPQSSELDLKDSKQVEEYLLKNKFDYIIHLAAHVGSLHDNIINSVSYFDENILMNTVITKYAYESGVKNFLGILSTCIYPDNCNIFPIKEVQLHEGKPHKDLMTYAYAKRSHSVQLDAYKKSYQVNYNYLIPCNIYGVANFKHKDRMHYINDLIVKIIKSKKENKDYIELFGDGTPLRQFMLAEDFAKIIFDYIRNGINNSFNIAPSWNMSIDEIARIALKACDASNFSIVYDKSKPNGQFRKDVDTKILKETFPAFEFTSLENGIKKIYNYYLENMYE